MSEFDPNILSFHLSLAFTQIIIEVFAAKRNQTVQEIKLFILKNVQTFGSVSQERYQNIRHLCNGL